MVVGGGRCGLRLAEVALAAAAVADLKDPEAAKNIYRKASEKIEKGEELMALVREGGVVILTHPTPNEFNPVHHPSYIDFFEEVLADTTDPHVMSQKWERQYAEDDWYRHLYRTTNAYHGVHPFYRARQIRQRRGQRLFLVEARNLYDQFQRGSSLSSCFSGAEGTAKSSLRNTWNFPKK